MSTDSPVELTMFTPIVSHLDTLQDTSSPNTKRVSLLLQTTEDKDGDMLDALDDFVASTSTRERTPETNGRLSRRKSKEDNVLSGDDGKSPRALDFPRAPSRQTMVSFSSSYPKGTKASIAVSGSWPFNSTSQRSKLAQHVLSPGGDDDTAFTEPEPLQLKSPSSVTGVWTPAFGSSPVPVGGLKVPRTPSFGIGKRFTDLRPLTADLDQLDTSSGLYKQCNSEWRSPATPTFGVGERFKEFSSSQSQQGDGVSVSPIKSSGGFESASEDGRSSPGLTTTLLRQPFSNWRSPPTPTMGGTGPRIAMHDMAVKAGQRAPGAIYNVRDAGRNTRASGFGYGERSGSPTRSTSPGPGVYDIPHTIGGSTTITKSRSCSFGDVSSTIPAEESPRNPSTEENAPARLLQRCGLPVNLGIHGETGPNKVVLSPIIPKSPSGQSRGNSRTLPSSPLVKHEISMKDNIPLESLEPVGVSDDGVPNDGNDGDPAGWPFNSTTQRKPFAPPKDHWQCQPPLDDTQPPTVLQHSTASSSGKWKPVFTGAVGNGGITVPATPSFGFGNRSKFPTTAAHDAHYTLASSTLLKQPDSRSTTPPGMKLGGKSSRMLFVPEAERAGLRSPGPKYDVLPLTPHNAKPMPRSPLHKPTSASSPSLRNAVDDGVNVDGGNQGSDGGASQREGDHDALPSSPIVLTSSSDIGNGRDGLAGTVRSRTQSGGTRSLSSTARSTKVRDVGNTIVGRTRPSTPIMGGTGHRLALRVAIQQVADRSPGPASDNINIPGAFLSPLGRSNSARMGSGNRSSIESPLGRDDVICNPVGYIGKPKNAPATGFGHGCRTNVSSWGALTFQLK